MCQSTTDKVHRVLAADDVPDTVARENQELVTNLTSDFPHFRCRTDHLLTRQLPGIGLVGKVAYGARATKATIHPVQRDWTNLLLLDKATSAFDAFPLRGQARLVILRKGHCLSFAAKDCSAVTCTRHDQGLRAHEADDGGATAQLNIFVSEARCLLLEEKLVDTFKSIHEGSPVVRGWTFRQLHGQAPTAELGHRSAAMAVEHTKGRNALTPTAEVGGCEVGILHAVSPALHAAEAPRQPESRR
mmetsp:Transcript_20162/g.45820  ORF Transcript_20162/g.45820 Transcript_20162/m.45820 type:complete len:245 (+) Transcript_20162:508-1242(+)